MRGGGKSAAVAELRIGYGGRLCLTDSGSSNGSASDVGSGAAAGGTGALSMVRLHGARAYMAFVVAIET